MTVRFISISSYRVFILTNHNEAEQLNMKGIFLHVLGDAVGSVVVILSAGLMYFYNNCSDDLNGKCVIHPSAMECGDFLVQDNGLNETDLKMYLNQSRE